MSARCYCPDHKDKRKKILLRIFKCICITFLIIAITILIVWAILQPKEPRFILQDATVYAFNSSSNPDLLTSNFQITIVSRNPNGNIGIYYDKLVIYATYHDQQITLRSTITPTYQGHHDVNVWSPFVYGVNVPVSPYTSAALTEDQANRSIMMMIKMDGHVRWKVGAFISTRYHLHVNCRAFIAFGSNSNGVVVSNNVVKYQLLQSCSVSV